MILVSKKFVKATAAVTKTGNLKNLHWPIINTDYTGLQN